MTSAFSRSLVRSPTSTPKPRAEGRVRASGTQATSRPERERRQVLLPLPKKSGIASAVPDFFVSERKDLAARFARRPTCGACRGALVACGDRPAPTEAAAETSPPLDFLLAFRVFSSGFTRSQLFPSSPAPKTHPVSPFSG